MSETRVTDHITPWSVCACKAKKPRDAINCGTCPQRRASMDESHYAATVDVALPTCDGCGRDIIPALGSMKPCEAAIANSIARYRIAECTCTPRHFGYKHRLTCLECSLKKTLRCECPRHGGANAFPERYLTQCAWLSQNYKDKNTAYRKACCYKCVERHKLETWEDYCIRNGNVSPDGEVIIVPGHQSFLSLTRTDPLEQYGGMAACWMPKKGIQGTYRIIDGVREPQWIAFLPRKYVNVLVGKTNHRVIVGTRYNPCDLMPELNVTMSSIWHPSINVAFDLILDPSGKSHPYNIGNIGFTYVRVNGLIQGTERHDLLINRYDEWKQDHHGSTIREWVQSCHRS